MSFYPDYVARFATFRRELAGRRVAVLGHQRPDGDCIGSQVALVRVLRSLGCDALGITPDPVPRRLKFLVADTPLHQRDTVAHDDDRLAIFTDCADHGRGGELLRGLYPEPFACFDHHISNVGFARHNFVDTGSAATAELLAGLCLDADLPLDVVSAQALFTGIMTDTGQFRFASTSARVFALAGELLARGASPARAGEELYERESAGKLRLLAHYLGSLRFECGGRACLGVLPQGIFEQVGATVEDTEGLVDYARSIEGVDIGVLIEERPGVIKASLRAQRAEFRVDAIAARFSGGGHASAAGLNHPATLAEFYPQLVAALDQRFREVARTS